MELIPLAAVAAAVVAIQWFLHRRKKTAWRRVLSRYGSHRGLKPHPTKGDALVGTIDGRYVMVEFMYRSEGDELVPEARVVVASSLPESGAVAAHSGASQFAAAFGVKDHPLGLPSFDRALHVRGTDEGAIIASLGHAARSALLRPFNERRLTIEGGKLYLRLGRVWRSDEEMDALVAEAIRVADAVVPVAESVEEQLAHHVSHDPEAGYRCRCLELLLSRAPESPEAVQALSAAIRSDAVELKLLAASRTPGARGLVALGEVAESADLSGAEHSALLAALEVRSDAVELQARQLELLAETTTKRLTDQRSAILGIVGDHRALAALRALPEPHSQVVRHGVAKLLKRQAEGQQGGLSLSTVETGGLTVSDGVLTSDVGVVEVESATAQPVGSDVSDAALRQIEAELEVEL